MKRKYAITMTCMLVPQDTLTVSFLRNQFSLETSRATMSQSTKGNSAQNPITLNTNSNPNSTKKCFKCGKLGHLQSECYSRDRGRGRGRGGSGRGRGNQANLNVITFMATVEVNKEGSKYFGSTSAFSEGQLTNLAIRSKMGKNGISANRQEAHVANQNSCEEWYLDSGCTQHMKLRHK